MVQCVWWPVGGAVPQEGSLVEVRLKAGGGLALTSSSLGRTVGSWFPEVWFEDQRYLLLPELTSVWRFLFHRCTCRNVCLLLFFVAAGLILGVKTFRASNSNTVTGLPALCSFT